MIYISSKYIKFIDENCKFTNKYTAHYNILTVRVHGL